MNGFDILSLCIFALAIIICAWKGFLKMLFKFGALAISVIIAKTFGSSLGAVLVGDVFKDSGRLPSSVAEKINSTVSSFLGTAIIFVLSYIILRIVFGLIAKLIKGGLKAGALDRVLGALIGVVFGFAIMYVITEAYEIVAATVSLIAPDNDMYSLLDKSVVYSIIEKIIF